MIHTFHAFEEDKYYRQYDVGTKDYLHRKDGLGIGETSVFPLCEAEQQPNPSHHLALPPTVISPNVIQLKGTDNQMITMINIQPHAAVDTHHVLLPVELSVPLVPGYSFLCSCPWTGENQRFCNDLEVGLHWDFGNLFILVIGKTKQVKDELLPFNGGVTCCARRETASYQDLRFSLLQDVPVSAGDCSRATGNDVRHGLLVPEIEVRAAEVTQANTSLLPSHPTSVTSGPIPVQRKDLVGLSLHVQLRLQLPLLEAYVCFFITLHVNVITIKIITLHRATHIMPRILGAGIEDNQAEH